MNGDLQELMTYIGEKHDAQMKALGELGREFSEFKGGIEARVTNAEAGIADLVETNKTAEKRQWVHSTIVFATAHLHTAISALGHLRF